jgi:radical SAM protein with 4Fe4S-binding SPASM domain
MSNDVQKKAESGEIQASSVNLGVQNASFPANYYSGSPCLVGYSYIRVMVDGNILPCCIAKHEVGDVHTSDWRDIWHSGAYENFRKKMSRIHVDRFHLVDPEWNFCQQCSHLPLNQRVTDLLKK